MKTGIHSPIFQRVAMMLLVLMLTTIGAWAQLGSCGEKCTYTLQNRTLIISGSGAMYSYSNKEDFPWYSCRESITSVVIEEGVESIGNDAFFGCTGQRERWLRTLSLHGHYPWSQQGPL